MKWNTEEIKNRAEQICTNLNHSEGTVDPPHLKVELIGAGGDHDTTQVCITAGEEERPDSIGICAFSCEQSYGENRDDVEAKMIEMNSGHDSRGGIMVDDELLMLAGFRLSKALEKEGWIIVPQMRDYF